MRNEVGIDLNGGDILGHRGHQFGKEARLDDEDALLQGGIEDPWGNELKYEKRGKKRPLITSAGPDGDFGTEDDITNVDTKKK